MNHEAALHPSEPETLPLEQQVARLQALLEATRKVHSTIKPREVMLQAARILVRELEVEGAQFSLPGSEDPVVSYGNLPSAASENNRKFPLVSRQNGPLANLTIFPADERPFTVYDRDFIEGLMLQTAVALENANLHERDVEWARVQQDLNAARSVQRSLLPSSMPQVSGFSIAGRSSTCYEVGGDYLDAIELADGTHLMVVADVAGKGLASAIVATSLRAAIRSLATQPVGLDELAARMGQQHWSEGDEARRRYMTALLLRLRDGGNFVEIVNAGHNPAALMLPDGTVTTISASGAPLGLLPGASYAAELLEFPPGARLLLYTDGLTEVFQGDEEFGEERLLSEFCRAPAIAEENLDHLWKTIHSFSQGAPQTDDMTAIVICRHKS